MKKLSYFAFVVYSYAILLILVSFNYSQANDSQSKWNDINMAGSEDKSKSLPFFPHRANSKSKAIFEKYDFEDAQVCGSCHTTIYQQCRNSMMAYAWDDPVYRALLKRASEATDVQLITFVRVIIHL
ncbi:MAG: hypothetical protein GY799_34255 [Desulfobulbaceae bacterium]|nr:hypothetical protein [Desulfobulbaceae bacterium]